jgi:UDP-3-O-[3-hydroxymyristoyl] N-acetylglucosamine deacetylase
MTTVRIQPARSHSGIMFVRTDLGGAEIPATGHYLNGSSYATTLARGAIRISTVEHLLSALNGLGIDNARIELDGPEVPILDGSAQPFVEAISARGIRRLNAPRRYMTLLKPIAVKSGDKEILALPANRLEATYAINFPHPIIGYQAATTPITAERFVSSIASARTFCLLRDVQALRRAGLARGGSLENALVVDDDGVMNEELRFPDEFVRHKILDLIGDLALLGAPLRAHVIAFKGGHALHAALIDRILKDRTACSFATSETQLPPGHLARFAHLTDRLVPHRVPLTA